MLIEVVLFVTCAFVLVFAGERLVRSASDLAMSLGLLQPAVGIIVVGLGTTLPTFAVAGMASARGQPDLVVGILVGSCILNLGLYLVPEQKVTFFWFIYE
jgi:cation:H+ antiporter